MNIVKTFKFQGEVKEDLENTQKRHHLKRYSSPVTPGHVNARPSKCCKPSIISPNLTTLCVRSCKIYLKIQLPNNVPKVQSKLKTIQKQRNKKVKCKLRSGYRWHIDWSYWHKKSHLCKYWCVSSPLVMAPTKREESKPRLFIFSMVTEERLEELLIITIFAPLFASFSTIN